ncbi:MAG: hypothetical protein MUE40_10430 [Anaerolineae bacterium]|jgi:hypothetical protein|nr:hypothetical protein [Anaerolineae bacterium]
MHSLSRVELLTRNFNAMQGLRFVPLALWLTVSGISDVLPGDKGLFGVVWLLMLPVCFGLYAVAAAYYRRQYGEVVDAPVPSQVALDALLAGLVIVLGLVEIALRPPVSPMFLTLAGYTAYRWWLTGRVFAHYPALAVLALVTALLPLLLPAVPRDELLTLAVGVFWLANSVLDHLALTRALRVPGEG